MMNWMDSCDRITLLVDKSLDEQLSTSERFRVKIHLMGCRFCRRYEKQVRFVKRAILEFDEKSPQLNSVHLSENIKIHIINTLKEELNNKKK
ncbi:MAG: hypothetical protein Kow00108_21060 [Calditrichia bacterium]